MLDIYNVQGTEVILKNEQDKARNILAMTIRNQTESEGRDRDN